MNGPFMVERRRWEGGRVILVDEASVPWRGRLWAHLVSDTSFDELHVFAAGLGIPHHAFQGDHYDLPSDLRLEAIARGAQPVGSKELVRRISAAGLRRRKPRREDRAPGT